MNYNDDYFHGCGEEKCLYPRCKKIIKNGARGLCNNHYSGWSRRVKEGQTTWEKLEEKGLCKKKLTRKERNERQPMKHKTYKRRSNDGYRTDIDLGF